MASTRPSETARLTDEVSRPVSEQAGRPPLYGSDLPRYLCKSTAKDGTGAMMVFFCFLSDRASAIIARDDHQISEMPIVLGGKTNILYLIITAHMRAACAPLNVPQSQSAIATSVLNQVHNYSHPEVVTYQRPPAGTFPLLLSSWHPRGVFLLTVSGGSITILHSEPCSGIGVGILVYQVINDLCPG